MADESAESAEEATLEGDSPYTPGSARAALAHRDFRVVWTGSLASNIGTWMQNVALGAFAYKLTKSPQFVALLYFAQLGPLLVLSTVGGLLADALDRRRLLVVAQAEQMVFSFVLAWIVHGANPSKALVVGCVTLIGIGNALNAPAFAAVLPSLVGRRDLTGAVSLQSVQMNVSRVVGPAIGGMLLPVIHAWGVFAVNGATYLFAIATLLAVRPPPVMGAEPGAVQGWRRLVAGFAIARRDRLVGRCLLTIASVSLLCLPFIGLMPVLAGENMGLDPNSAPYGWLYACFGLGAATGAVSVGTVLVKQSRPRLVRLGLASFSAMLLVFALVRSVVPGYPVAFLVGLTYFTTVTSLSTHLQEHLSDVVRGRVMALWIMGFGGTVPLGTFAGGFIADRVGITAVVAGGAVFALLLALSPVTDLRPAGWRDRAVGDTAPAH
jgi:MFS family permease